VSEQTNRGPVARTTPRPPSPVVAALGSWASSGHGTLAQRLAHGLRQAIDAGLLADGTPLPAERALAATLAVSRSTVTHALDELRADGRLVSRQGSGTVVRGRRDPEVGAGRIAEHFAGVGGIDLATANPVDPSHLPPVTIDIASLMSGGDGPGVQPLGLVKLRSALAARETATGPFTDAEQIHVTSGAHQAVALAASAVMGPGDVLATEDPSYPGIFDIADVLGARAVGVEGDAAGMKPEALRRVLSTERPALLYVQTGPNNPTGRVPSPARLRALADVLDEHGSTTVLEDAALSELTFAGRIRPELAELCRRAPVVSVRSFSKVAWGGLRIGWLRAPSPIVERTMHRRLALDLGSSVPSQLFALALLDHLDDIAEHRRRTLRTAVERAVERLAVELPEWQITPPLGGSVLWAELPVTDTGPYVQLARRHGVHVLPGSISRPQRVDSAFVRICVDRSPDVVDAGLQRLATAWLDYQASTARPRVVTG
jgi:DNA-binding transcriptional MocR family regulator